jgi:hypothetical protein
MKTDGVFLHFVTKQAVRDQERSLTHWMPSILSLAGLYMIRGHFG